MNRRETGAVVFSILAALPPAVAQSPTPSASPGASAVVPSQEETKLRARRDAATDADARLCLEYPTNLQVILCAEKYRSRKRNA